ncbi:hypothetical protein FB561_1465 [Kribbella amoyensis]|uniref:Uncharacterized protein n=1 Tax=Kribbella amoyensis TaxID=996641 RepID=A0A561BNC2_9ACTN|nr:hypothetical protein [Kribbella amoyensis]TWD80390.1 hypothetical protein FB561_1465 [Kribbella amoyensis]
MVPANHLLWLYASTVLPASVVTETQSLTQTQRVAVWIGTGLAAVALYLLGCLIFPFANCTKCAGSGKSRAPRGKSFRNCRRCKGTGRRTRIGRRLIDAHRNRTR